MSWQGRRVLVTGGASFIGSHLVDALVARGACVRVVDNFSSGKRENIRAHLEQEVIELHQGDLLDAAVVRQAVKGMQTIFHLAADHGGRGYVDLHQVACSTNVILDGQVFNAAAEAGVEKLVFASSGCVYPNHLQTDPKQELYLTEEMVGPPYDADNLYGWAKLMAEMTLRSYAKEGALRSACCRFFTVYGPRGIENHAVIAMIARAFIRENPFTVWGTGEQVRNWTYIDDIVTGMILAAEKIDDGDAVNLGTMERIRVIDAVRMVMEYAGHEAALQFQPGMPTGPYNRVADNMKAKTLLGWEPQISFAQGCKRTVEWYYSTHQASQVKSSLERMLTER